jgi:ATP-dependent DNA ligase
MIAALASEDDRWDPIREHLDGDCATVFAHACKLGLEGIVSKHREHPYRSGPSKWWSTSRPPKHSASLSRSRCLAAPTR